MVVVRDVPMGSPLLTCTEPPSLVRMLVPCLVASYDGVREEGLPVFLMGLHPFYPLRQQHAVAAVHYVHGNGGLLVCEWFPGLHDACTRVDVHTPPRTSLVTISTLCRSERPTMTPLNWTTRTTLSSQPMMGR